MALAYNHEEITPRELKPALLELDGISRETIEAHYKLYQGYVNKRNEILGKLDGVDLASANQVYSELRSLKVDLTFAIGGIKNHEIYFEHLGGSGGDPAGIFGDLVKRDFGSIADWKADLKATGMAGRGWAWTAYDWDEGRLFNYIGDAQNTFPVWNATPLVALDVYEHAYFVDFGTDRAGYIDAFFNNLDYDVVNDWAQQYGIDADGLTGRRSALALMAFAALVVLGYLLGSCPWGYWLVRLVKHEDIRKVGSGNIGATNVWRTYGRWLGAPVVLLDVLKGFVPALLGMLFVSPHHLSGISPAPPRCSGTGGRSSCASRRAGRWSRPAAACSSASLSGSRCSPGSSGSSSSSCCATRRSRRSSAASRCRSARYCYGYPNSVVVFGVAAAAAILFLHRANLAPPARRHREPLPLPAPGRVQ